MIISSVSSVMPQQTKFKSKKVIISKDVVNKRKAKAELLFRMLEYCDGFRLGRTIPNSRKYISDLMINAQLSGRKDFLMGLKCSLEKRLSNI